MFVARGHNSGTIIRMTVTRCKWISWWGLGW